MKVEILQLGVGKVLKATLEKNEHIFSEPGAFLGSKGDVEIDSSMRGGLIGGALRMVAGGESAWINKLIAKDSPTEIYLAPAMAADIKEIELKGEEYVLGDGAYLAHTGDIDVSAKFGGLSAMMAGYGLMFLKASGTGMLYVSGEGGIVEVELGNNEVAIVDNTNFLATNTTNMEKIYLARGIKSALFGGEGVGFRIRGPAKVYIRTSSTAGLAEIIAKYLKV